MSLPPNPLSESPPPLEAPLPQPAPPPRRDPVWNGWDVVMIVVVFILAVLFIRGVLAPRGRHVAAGTPQMLRVMLLAQFLSYVVVLLFMREMIVRQYHVRFSEAVRWQWPREHRWLAYVVAGMALAIFVQLLSTLLPIPRTLPIDRYFQSRSAAYMMSAFGISMAPLVEELFFRGFLLPVLARRLGLAAGVVLTALAFALMHASQLASAWAPLLMLFLVGMVFTLVRVITRSVAPGFLMHVGYNFMLFSLLYIGTGGFRHMERIIQQ